MLFVVEDFSVPTKDQNKPFEEAEKEKTRDDDFQDLTKDSINNVDYAYLVSTKKAKEERSEKD